MCIERKKVRFNPSNEIPMGQISIMGHNGDLLTVGSANESTGRWPEFLFIDDMKFEFKFIRRRRGLERKFFKSKATYSAVAAFPAADESGSDESPSDN